MLIVRFFVLCGCAAFVSPLAPVNCLFINQEVRCTIEEDLHVSSPPIWPSVLGIGPAKSGSSNLIDMLTAHPDVEIAHVPCGGNSHSTCRTTEVAFFHRDFKMEHGLAFYASRFKWRSGLHAVGEKTPGYAAYPLAPYNVKAFLPNIKLLYTTRDAFEEDVSLYLFRKMPQQNVTYMRWIMQRMLTYEKRQKCLHDEWNKLFLPQARNSSTPHLSDLHTTSIFVPPAAYLIEYQLHESCPLLSVNEDPGHFDHYTNLRRWLSVFDSSQLFCARNSDQLHDATISLVRKKLLRFLDLRLVEPTLEKESSPREDVWARLRESQKLLNVAKGEYEQTLLIARRFFHQWLDAEKRAYIDNICPGV